MNPVGIEIHHSLVMTSTKISAGDDEWSTGGNQVGNVFGKFALSLERHGNRCIESLDPVTDIADDQSTFFVLASQSMALIQSISV
jgi:hypothetical protein